MNENKCVTGIILSLMYSDVVYKHCRLDMYFVFILDQQVTS